MNLPVGVIMRFIVVLLLLTACEHTRKPLSFYYWKTTFSLNAFEKKILQEQQVKKLYIRYFDVDDTGPIAPIQLHDAINQFEVVPVIYIKNKTFEKSDSTLARKIFILASRIHQTSEIQFDCDWTLSTRDNYFEFLRQYKRLSNQTVTATIRLHQVKYKQRTGVPPVDRGILMYYNMGEINPGTSNSIYEKNIAGRYNQFIKSYPLELDIALPIFSWGYIVREGKVVRLLNKMNVDHFKNDANFIAAGKNRFRVQHACFKAGYYFQLHDMVKLEHVPEKELLDISKDIKKYAGRTLGEVILYDLDSSNIVQYDKDLFEKILDNLD